MLTTLLLDEQGVVVDAIAEPGLPCLGLACVVPGEVLGAHFSDVEAEVMLGRAVALATAGATVSGLRVPAPASPTHGEDCTWMLQRAHDRGGAAVVVTASPACSAPARPQDPVESALADFAAGVAHEIRNLSAIIRGLVELVSEGHEHPLFGGLDPVRDLLATCARVDRLADRLGQYARPPGPPLEAVDLADGIAKWVAELRTIGECELTVEPVPEGLSAQTTRTIVDTVLHEIAQAVPRLDPARPLHLVVRVREAHMEVGATSEPARPLQHPAGRPQTAAPVCIEATLRGTHQSDVELAHALLPYHRPHGHTHLGIHLALAYRILAKTGGGLSVYTAPDGVTIAATFSSGAAPRVASLTAARGG